MKNIIVTLLVLLITYSFSQSQEIRKKVSFTPLPDWIKKYEVDSAILKQTEKQELAKECMDVVSAVLKLFIWKF